MGDENNMGIDRVLKVDLDTAVRLLEGTKWKFYEIISDDTIRVEVPKNDETLVVELKNTKETIRALNSEGFIEQEIRAARAY